ncbi:MAG: tRNA (guanosine(37)-N1)-methyltransferase TrmD, partial [Peptococcaceae bacterium]|nr:tRNA (guanosine(37)-N1)-methyltransferase TrmD [Peptococcaceae bacterium]
EGVDQRFIDAHVTVQLSLGDFVLSGGEIAALALLDAVARLQPGVLSDEGSHQFDSFNPALDGLLDYLLLVPGGDEHREGGLGGQEAAGRQRPARRRSPAKRPYCRA